MVSDTIFALSSGSGRAGVAVIRASGLACPFILRKLCADVVPARTASLRAIIDPETGGILDHGIVLFFPGPRSFTGEDVVEFQVHGSIAVVKRLMAVLSGFERCRPAEPGEFTRRAFFNGRMDLLDVEALSDLLGAETETQRKLAVDGSRRLRLVASEWRTRLIQLRAICEAYIDFSDEGDVSGAIDSESERELASLRMEITQALSGLDVGSRVRQGFRVAVLGPPNAGKSTLVNALADREVSITSAMPGTTRDVVEVHLDLEGVAVIVSDTAGIRERAGDGIEEEGIRRAWGAAGAADVVLWVSAFDSGAECPDPHYIRVVSKADDGRGIDAQEGLAVSAKSGFGMAALVQAIRARCALLGGDMAFDSLIAHERQAASLRNASVHLGNALAFSDSTLDMRAEEIRLACQALDGLVGKVGNEEVLDVVFSQFCIGK